MQWVAYRNKRGTLNSGFRTEIAVGQLSALMANLNSKDGGYKVHDFAPHLDEPKITLNDAMRDWS